LFFPSKGFYLGTGNDATELLTPELVDR